MISVGVGVWIRYFTLLYYRSLFLHRDGRCRVFLPELRAILARNRRQTGRIREFAVLPLGFAAHLALFVAQVCSARSGFDNPVARACLVEWRKPVASGIIPEVAPGHGTRRPFQLCLISCPGHQESALIRNTLDLPLAPKPFRFQLSGLPSSVFPKFSCPCNGKSYTPDAILVISNPSSPCGL
jgi:hypothetical protein